jgi:rhamnulokinase
MTVPDGERYVAIDLGAESGRTVLGTLADGSLHLEEIHRFPNGPVRVLDSLHWDVLRLWEEMKIGLARVAAGHGRELAGIGLDTWGADFALLDHHGALLGMPYHYRDSRTEDILETLSQYISEWELYSETGLSSLSITTLCQLLAMRKQGAPALDAAHALLMMPDLFTFWLCGLQATESTIAGITQFFDLTMRDWSRSLLEKLDLPAALPREVLSSATVLEPLLPSVAEEVGLDRVPIIATATHDTAAAAAVVPNKQEHFTFISSGTWSVLGAELSEPLITEDGLRSQFLNEVGACGRIMFAHNSMGLWPVQECRREWRREGHDWDYADLTEMATQAPSLSTILNPDDEVFLRPGDMRSKISGYCQRTGQELPSTPGSVIRSLLEGLALRYRMLIEDLERLTGWPTERIHIMGGGSKNWLLCQLTADATKRPVLAGPAEATAIATVLLQALARGSLSSLNEVREVVSGSFDLVNDDPHPSLAWDEAYGRFLQVIQSE